MSDSVFDQWLESGTVRTEDVKLYADQALMGEMYALMEQRDALEAAPASGQRAMGDANPLKALEAAERDLWARYEASASTWTVRALTPVEVKKIRESFPEPNAPQMLPKVAPAKAKAAWAVERDQFIKASEAAAHERNLHFIATATIKVVTGTGEADGVTVDQVRAMNAREYGPDRVGMLIVAINKATQGEVEMPRPKSLNGSESTPE